MSPLLSTPVLLEPGAEAVAKPSLVAVSRPSRAVGGRQRLGAPGRIDELDPVAGGVDVGRDVHARGARLGVDVVHNVLQRHGPGQVDVDGIPLAVSERHGSQAPQPLAAIEIGKEHGVQPAQNLAARDGAGAGGIDHQSQIAGRGGTRGIGNRERASGIVGRGLVGDHQALAGNGDLQFVVALGFDLLDEIANGRIAAEPREIDRARRAVVQGIVDIGQSAGRGRIGRLHAHAIVQGGELEVAGEREDVRAGKGVAAGSCRSEVQESQRGGRRAAIDLLNLEIRRRPRYCRSRRYARHRSRRSRRSCPRY